MGLGIHVASTSSNLCTVEPQLSEPTWRHTIGSDKRGVRRGEMESCSDENWGSVGDNRWILDFSRKMGTRHYITISFDN